MAEPARKPSLSSYEQDFAAWSEEQARLLLSRNVAGLDWDNLAEEVESLGRRERTEIRNRLRLLLVHLLKWEFQPGRRGHSWQTTIGEQRIHIAGIVDDSPSLRSHPDRILDDCYVAARRTASVETGLPVESFPARVPYTIEQTLDDGFMPGQPWSPEQLR